MMCDATWAVWRTTSQLSSSEGRTREGAAHASFASSELEGGRPRTRVLEDAPPQSYEGAQGRRKTNDDEPPQRRAVNDEVERPQTTRPSRRRY
mmetsp:Transcript_49658/g.105562  ORF Transcript_49658/g.105562 Transcript_49658/m.105562 type:complete len:93 (-) Transcript_49658:828-1106(-)